MGIIRNKVDWQQIRAHEEKLYRAIHAAHLNRQHKKANYLQRRFLESRDACMVAVRVAYYAMNPRCRPPVRTIAEIAARLNPWRGTQERVIVDFKPKKSNPHLFRPILKFGIENRALQYLVSRAIEGRADFSSSQFAYRGGRDAAVRAASLALESGYRHVVEIDIHNCYPSFDGNQLSKLLPVPKEVTARVILSRELNLYPGNMYFGPDDGSWEGIDPLAEDIEEARQGIPQGSAVSSLVAELVLAPVLTQLPETGVIVNYADNILVMARKHGETVSICKALCSALKAHPAGPLQPNEPKTYKPLQVVEFLGYSLMMKGNQCRVEPTEQNRQKFTARFSKLRKAALANGLPADICRKRVAVLRHYVVSWSGAFPLWPDASDHRKHFLDVVRDTASGTKVP